MLDVSPHQHSLPRSNNVAIPGSGSTSLLYSVQHHNHHLQQQQQQHLDGSNMDGTSSGLSGLANTGSLPDLTLRDHLMPTVPMSVPLPDEIGPYPGSVPSGPYNPATSSPQSPKSGTSPGPSPSLSRRHKPKPYPQLPCRQAPPSQNLLSVPSIVSSNFLHTCKGSVLVDPGMADTGGGGTLGYQTTQSYTLYNPTTAGGVGSIPSSPTAPGPPVGVYRSPSPDSRSAPPSPGCLPSQASPSPVSSPGINIPKPFSYDSISPTYSSLHPTQLHHQFEQITVLDAPMNNIDSRTSQLQQQPQPMSTDSGHYSSPSSSPNLSCVAYPTSPSSQDTATPQHSLPHINTLPQLSQLPQSPLQQQPPASPTSSMGPHSPATPGGSNSQQSLNMNPATPQTPQTPNSIPKVVLTDHDGNNDILKDFTAVFEDDPENLQNFLSQLGVDDVNMMDGQDLDYSAADVDAALPHYHDPQQPQLPAGAAFLQHQPQ
ncbi:leucine-rich repeat extensin-like protein 5 [Hyalella azteca]|uniref:Leucine-rich repeat extensin-like protein 5 n=1 Tax=Hyalella azteca TaxID=294128 RepID=A0A979FHE0_HYAAZ|nr:leucine-rich repeat extensin-like protein 5 [Hyalella azteca]